MLYPNWSRVRYIGPLAVKEGGEDAKIIEYVDIVNKLYKIKYFVHGAGKNQELIVPEDELADREEFVYRWVSPFGESHRIYANAGPAQAQANYNKGKRQRARVIWEDC